MLTGTALAYLTFPSLIDSSQYLQESEACSPDISPPCSLYLYHITQHYKVSWTPALILYLLCSFSLSVTVQILPRSDDKADESAQRRRQGMCLSESPPSSIIYRLVSLRLGADSFIRWGGSCFDLKIHTIIASGVEKVKEFPCVLIRKKPPDSRGEEAEDWRARWRWACINSHSSECYLPGEYESRGCVCTGGWVNKDPPAQGPDFELVFGLVGSHRVCDELWGTRWHFFQ